MIIQRNKIGKLPYEILFEAHRCIQYIFAQNHNLNYDWNEFKLTFKKLFFLSLFQF
jgi:hypothetical protein